MATYNPLSWQNENSLSSYPFDTDQDIQDFIVDAQFVQFDLTIPVLNYVLVDVNQLTLNITFDEGLVDVIFLKTIYNKGPAYRTARIYNSAKNRYLGSITFGPGTQTLWSDFVGRKIQYTVSFMPETTKSIPSKDAVYIFDGNYGDIRLSRTQDDSTIFYNIASNLNAVVFNAVGGHSVAGIVPEGLRKINLVGPKNNNINLAANDVIKVSSLNGRSVSIDLVAGSSAKAFVLPTLTS
jgi:hypothetical protein